MDKPLPAGTAIQSWYMRIPKMELHLHLEERLGFSRPDLRTLILNALFASWLPAEKKSNLSASFLSDPAWQEN